MKRIGTALALTIAACLALSRASADQSYDQFAPKPVPPAARSTDSAPAADTRVAGEPEQTLLPELKGLLFVASPADIDPNGTPAVRGVEIHKGLVIPAAGEFDALVASYIGAPLTRARLNKLIGEVILHFRKNDHPVVDVVVPQQDISSGVIQVIVLESRVGKVLIRGNHWFPSDLIRRDFTLQPGDDIVASKMRADLEWANQNPFRTSDVVYEPGELPGTTDVEIQTKDRVPLRLYAGYEDSGNAETGFDRYLVGVNWGDAWNAGWDQQLNYQYTTSADFRHLQAHSGSYVIPLKWRHTLTLIGNYVQTLGSIPPLTSIDGRSYQVSARYTVPLKPVGDFKHSAGLGFDYKYNLNSLQFGDIPLTSVPIEVRQFVATYDASLRDSRGLTSLSVQGFWSPGNWGGDNSDAVFSQAHSLATSKYEYEDVTLTRLTRLPADWSLFLRAMVQFSDANLVPSEQYGVGGYDTVRGYDEREVNTDEGYLVNAEVRTPVLPVLKRLGWSAAQDQLQFLGFWDYGVGNDHTLLPLEPSDSKLSSVGVGLRYSANTNVSVRADYGRQLIRSLIDNDHGGRFDVGIVVSY